MDASFPEPGSQADVQLAARLVVDGILPESTVRAVLAKQRELKERGRPISVAEICQRKGWITMSEVRWLSSMESPAKDLLPGLTLKSFLGQGGMSKVYGGVDQQSGESVAVKVLLPALRRQDETLAEFRAEGELLVSLEHENLVRGYYVNEHDGLVYLVMEIVDGRSVQQHLDDAGRFDEDAALYLILQTARALTHLHARGLVHRDIKPGNILINDENVVKICDLGLAIKAGSGDGETTAGTAHYIAPEQARAGGGLDVRSDIYALGVTLYQLMVGKLPFEGETNQETMAKRLLDELRSPELKGIAVSPHVHYFVQKMMALDREVRYQSPQELIDDIEEQIRGAKSLDAQPGKSRAGNVELQKPFKAEKSKGVVKKTGQGARRPSKGWNPPRRRPGR
ncbi:MAG: hypothetical protein CMJ83_03365 [Planctomycetes bacterium]|nr:hypothetical protein [Planctomycetota bacterium]